MSTEDCKQVSQLNIGDRILRCWSDGKEYPAMVLKKNAIHYILYYPETNELEEVLVISFEEGSDWHRCTPASTVSSKLDDNIKGTEEQRNDTPTATKDLQNDVTAKTTCKNAHVRNVTTNISTGAKDASNTIAKENPAENVQNDTAKAKPAPENVHVQNITTKRSADAMEVQNKATKDKLICKYNTSTDIKDHENMKHGSEPYAIAQDIVPTKLSRPAIFSKSALLLCAGSLMGLVGLSLGLRSFDRR